MFRRTTFATLIPAPRNTASRLSTASEICAAMSPANCGEPSPSTEVWPAQNSTRLPPSTISAWLNPNCSDHCHGLTAVRCTMRSSLSTGHGTTRSVGSNGMAHPRMYSDDDPYLAELRDVCLAFPESSEVEAWGRPTFRAGKKLFAVFSGTDDRPWGVVFKPEPDERPALLQDRRFYVPAYFGPSGWLALDFGARRRVDWSEVAELMESSYRQVALKRMLKALEEGG